jgi:GNAT superfamily N-acetyltransferase
MKTVFSQSFDDTWKNGVAFDQDNVITATTDGKIVGFVFIHNTTPYKFRGGSTGFYMYNLCVSPLMRKTGIGTKLIKSVQDTYVVVHLHRMQKNNTHAWLVKMGFTAREMWRGELLEYTYPDYMVPKENVNVGLNAPTSMFDAIEGVMYMS